MDIKHLARVRAEQGAGQAPPEGTRANQWTNLEASSEIPGSFIHGDTHSLPQSLTMVLCAGQTASLPLWLCHPNVQRGGCQARVCPPTIHIAKPCTPTVRLSGGGAFGRSLDLDEVVKAGPRGRDEHPYEKGKTKLSPWEEERLCEN